MSRPLRICIPGGIYHLIARGNARGRIVRDNVDRRRFLDILGKVVERFGWLCHAYCLMDNHYHLVAETPRPNLPSGMRQLNGLYAQSFNRRHRRCGHVFEARYRSRLVERDSYLKAVCRYVVLNPVKAGICSHPQEWPWSSYRATVGLEAPPPFLTTDWLLAQFAPTRKLAQRRYRAYVEEGLDDEPNTQSRAPTNATATHSAKSPNTSAAATQPSAADSEPKKPAKPPRERMQDLTPALRALREHFAHFAHLA